MVTLTITGKNKIKFVCLHIVFYKKPSFWVFAKVLRINLEKFLNSFSFQWESFRIP